jgi:branched-chain amino acid transport system ATP-binding protein
MSSARGEPSDAILRVEGIVAGYRQVPVLHGFDLQLATGTVVALVGPNGAGKTTALRVIDGRLRPRAGSVRFAGRDVTGTATDRLARRGLCTIPAGRGVFPNLTVAENLWMWTYRGGVRRPAVEDTTYGRFPFLADRRNQLAGTLSGGEQRMLAISRALSTNPRLLLLDEPSTGLAPIAVAELYEVVAQLAADGLSILLVEQFTDTALRIADRAVLMANGRIEIAGRPDEIRDAMARVYLGG